MPRGWGFAIAAAHDAEARLLCDLQDVAPPPELVPRRLPRGEVGTDDAHRLVVEPKADCDGALVAKTQVASPHFGGLRRSTPQNEGSRR
jgi:hypothetical protein